METTLKLTVETKSQMQAVLRLLRNIPFLKITETAAKPVVKEEKYKRGSYQALEAALKQMPKGMFKEIDDPVEWQRQIRSEWDRDLKIINPII